MIPADLAPIVEGLLEKARNGEVNWVVAADLGMGSAHDDVVVSFPDYSINLYSGEDSDTGAPLLAMNLLNSRGVRIHGFSTSPGDSGYKELDELLTIANRKLLGVDEALAALERALQQPGVVGSKPERKAKPPRTEDLPF